MGFMMEHGYPDGLCRGGKWEVGGAIRGRGRGEERHDWVKALLSVFESLGLAGRKGYYTKNDILDYLYLLSALCVLRVGVWMRYPQSLYLVCFCVSMSVTCSITLLGVLVCWECGFVSVKVLRM